MNLQIAVGDRIIDIDSNVNEVRRFLSHYEKVIAGEPQTQRRFVLRGGGDDKTRTLLLDLRNVQWVITTEDTPAE